MPVESVDISRIVRNGHLIPWFLLGINLSESQDKYAVYCGYSRRFEWVCGYPPSYPTHFPNIVHWNLQEIPTLSTTLSTIHRKFIPNMSQNIISFGVLAKTKLGFAQALGLEVHQF